MRKLFLLIVMLILIGLSGIYYMNNQTPLSSESELWLSVNASAVEDSQNGFVYLYGISAAEGESPLVIGRAKINNKANLGTELEDYIPNRFVNVELPLYCERLNISCFGNIVKQSSQRKTLIKSQELVLQRYKTFLTFRKYQNPNIEFEEEIKYLQFGQFVTMVKVIDDLQSQRVARNLQPMLVQLNQMRNLLAQIDNADLKATMADLISEQLTLIGLTSQYFNIKPIVEDRRLRPLTSAETSFKKIFIKGFDDIYQNTVIDPYDNYSLPLAWYDNELSAEILLDKNDLTNYLQKKVEYLIDVSEGDDVNFDFFISGQDAVYLEPMSEFNIIGKARIPKIAPFSSQMTKVRNLNSKLQLTRFWVNQPHLIRDVVKGIYHKDTPLSTFDFSQPTFDAKSYQLCMSANFGDKNQERCMPILPR